MNNKIEILTETSKKLGDDVFVVSREILDNPDFAIWSGSSSEKQHHYGEGGLLDHTFEVINLVLESFSCYQTMYDLDSKELFLAALFHDVGKLHDYERMPGIENCNHYWQKTKHCRLIHHISRSALIWSENAKKDQKIFEQYHDSVLHAILSHHTCREWGSPVAPKTRTAWLLSLCDNISARMNDADKWDCIEGVK